MYIKTKEAAEIIGVSISTINKMIREGRLKPINQDSYRLDGGYLFSEHDVLKVAEQMQQVKGYTIKEFADLTGVSEAIIRSDIQKGNLPAVQSTHGRREWSISPDALAKYQKNKTVPLDHRTAPIYHEQYYLFQKVTKDNQVGRIIQISKDAITIQMMDGTKTRVIIHDLNTWTPLNSISHKTLITYPGHVDFEFSVPDHIEDPKYQVINLLIHHAGIENVHCKVDHKIFFSIKRVNVPKEIFHEWITLLKTHLVSGEIIEKHQSYLLQPDLYSVTTYVSKDIKQRIQDMADKDGKSLQENVRELILLGLESIGEGD